MRRLVIALALTTVALGLLTAEASAAGGPFQRWRAANRPNPHDQPVAAQAGRIQPFPWYSRYQSVEDAYPKYIGAFHARYFENLGIPSGDVGIRANTVQMLPW